MKHNKKLPMDHDDRILTKSYRCAKVMIEKIKKDIIVIAEDGVLNLEKKDIEHYLSEVKKAVGNDRYRLEKAKDIILSLSVMDFSEILQNEHKGFEHERLYVFGKDVTLLERNGTEEKTVSLYIKFNKLENCFVIIISFHEQKYPISYYFK